MLALIGTYPARICAESYSGDSSWSQCPDSLMFEDFGKLVRLLLQFIDDVRLDALQNRFDRFVHFLVDLGGIGHGDVDTGPLPLDPDRGKFSRDV